MKKIYFGKIYPAEEGVSILNKPSLCNQQIKFLNPILLQTTAIDESVKNFELKVTFFQGSRFSQNLHFYSFSQSHLFHSKEELNSVSSEKLGIEESLGNVAIALNITPLEEELVIKNLSWFIRNSDTLDKNEFMNLSNECRSIDGRGMAIFEPFGSIASSYRQVFLIMLALAYYNALHKMSEELATILVKSDNIQELDRLYIEAATFNARYYFDNPIEFSRYPTFRAWETIREAYHLRAKNNEVTSQLARVHQILSYTQQKAEQNINEKRNWRLGLIGLVLAGTGLIEVIDILLQWIS